jgi:hypothetical protein
MGNLRKTVQLAELPHYGRESLETMKMSTRVGMNAKSSRYKSETFHLGKYNSRMFGPPNYKSEVLWSSEHLSDELRVTNLLVEALLMSTKVHTLTNVRMTHKSS